MSKCWHNLFYAQSFQYNEEKDYYICPMGKHIPYRKKCAKRLKEEKGRRANYIFILIKPLMVKFKRNRTNYYSISEIEWHREKRGVTI